MKNKKLKLIYDANSLCNGLKKTASRAGIYFCVLNILKEMAKRDDLDISLYVTPKTKKNVQKLIKLEFPDKKFKILTLLHIPNKSKIDNFAYICASDRNFFSSILERIFIYLHYYITILLFKIYCFILSFNKYDAFYSSNFSFFNAQKELHIKSSYTLLHDITPILYPSYFPPSFADKFKKEMISTINEKDYYFTNSEHTRKDFLKYVPIINPEHITNTYIGCNVTYDVKDGDLERVKRKYNIPNDKKYLFSLCTLEQRKNLIRNIQTFMQFIKKHNIEDLIFVMGGGFWEHFIEKLNSAVSDLNTKKIIKIGYVDDADLPVLYSGAEWFTYTSEYEGFGLPVLEAMKCGCPVITSNNSSLPEVIGDAGIKIDFNSDKQHIEAYEKYYFDENLRKENAKKGLERAELFTWEKTVNKMLDIIIKNNNKFE